MDHRFSVLINDYLTSVSSTISILEGCGLIRPSSREEWAFSPPPHWNVLAKPFSLHKHGFGLKCQIFRLNINFDFGKHGEINGFDAWWLAEFAQNQPGKYEHCTYAELIELVEDGVATCEIFFEEGLYYLTANRK